MDQTGLRISKVLLKTGLVTSSRIHRNRDGRNGGPAVKIVKKLLCVGALVAATAGLGTVGTAMAASAPAPHGNIQTVSAVKSSGTIASTNVASRGGSVVPNADPVVFICSYFSIDPFRSF